MSTAEETPEWAIICPACDEPHHYDHRKSHCLYCGSFLPDATEEQHDAFTEWYVERCEAFERGELDLDSSNASFGEGPEVDDG